METNWIVLPELMNILSRKKNVFIWGSRQYILPILYCSIVCEFNAYHYMKLYETSESLFIASSRVN